MRRPDWVPAQEGVMLYLPSTRASVAEAEDGLGGEESSGSCYPSEGAQSQVSRVSEAVLVSCEGDEVGEVRVKDELGSQDGGFSRENSVVTLVGDGEEILVEVSPVRCTPASSVTVRGDLLEQLLSAAGEESLRGDKYLVTAAEECVEDSASGGWERVGYENDSDRADAHVTAEEDPSKADIESAAYQEHHDVTERFQEKDYDSDRTDFLESPSPCQRKFESKKIRRRSQSAVSRHFKKPKPQQKQQRLPIWQPNFGTRLKKQAEKKSKTSNALSLEHLRSLERAPRHTWTDDERELLSVLNRWYTASDQVFATLFNSVFGLDVPPRTVRGQFKCHLTLYGGEAYPVFARVFSVPFDDPEAVYAVHRTLIEEEAVSLGLNLQQRANEAVFSSGAARKAKSPQTRRMWESLVEKAERQRECESQLQNMKVSVGFSMAMGMAVCAIEDEEWELITDVEGTPILDAEDDCEIVPGVQQSPISAHEPASARPHLAFRVWDSGSRSEFLNGGFVAQAFVDWPRPFLAPVALDDPSGAGKILTVLHLSRKGDTPVYISTASSLLQALSYATSMQQPTIALIDLSAPSLQQDNKLHHAADIFRWLKSQGLARWARYKGNGEYFAWAEIPHDAVLQVFSVEDLVDLLDRDTDCRDLLRFDTFKPGANTSTIAAALREKNTTLNTATARALGKTAKAFGLSKANITLEHLQDFVARVMDGWTIEKPESMDVHTLSSLAVAFAFAMGSHAGGFGIQQVMGAFIEGVEQGAKCIAHWSGSRSGSRRRRFREA